MNLALIGQEAAFLGPGTGRGLQGPDRARRVVPGPYSRRARIRPITHPLHPLQGFRGPLRWLWVSLRGGWVVPGIAPLPLPTHPYHTPLVHPSPYPVLGVPETVRGPWEQVHMTVSGDP